MFVLTTLFLSVTMVGIRHLWSSHRTTNGKYRGVQYWKKGVTQGYQTLYETTFARFQIHQVLLEDGKTIINDWMWVDESDHINVLVQEEESAGNTNAHFLVLKQTKYAIDGPTYAVVGGMIEPGELPVDAAKREVKEELGMVAEDWLDLGSYRAAANRGGGTTYTFLARKATSSANGTTKQRSSMVAEGELERQDLVKLSREELREALLSGMFKEIKWTACVALALLQTENS